MSLRLTKVDVLTPPGQPLKHMAILKALWLIGLPQQFFRVFTGATVRYHNFFYMGHPSLQAAMIIILLHYERQLYKSRLCKEF